MVTPKQKPAAVTASPAVATSKVSEQPTLPESTIDLNGRWQADVNYSWGISQPEVMNLRVNHGEVLGTISYLRTPRPALARRLSFTKDVLARLFRPSLNSAGVCWKKQPAWQAFMPAGMKLSCA